jgi:hypothetical protein
MFPTLRSSCILLALLSLGVIANAQTGTPQFGSLESGGFDVTNHQDLNVNFTIPLASKPGRGMPVSLAINYNSAIWTPVTPVSTTTWSPASGYGWSYPSPVGSITWTYSWDHCCPGKLLQ